MARKTVKIFLDSNVIISGFLSDRGAPRIILDLLSLRLPFITAATGRYNLIEIERNIAKKLPEIMEIYREYFPKIHLKVTPLPKEKDLKRYRGMIDKKDLPVLVSAMNFGADFLVTGDKKDFAKIAGDNRLPLKIVSPAELLDVIKAFLE
ncbi:MAG: PIN domain-containing protein [Syntrophales bacterium]